MRCDLHIHTSYSFDCLSSPKKMVDAAIKKGIDCLAITDHSQIQGSLEAIIYAKDKPILIIPGIEAKSKEGDILGLNLKTIIPDKLSAKETIKRIKKAGGMAIIPHPFGLLSAFKTNLDDLVNEIDGVEIFNASVLGLGNKKAVAFAEKFKLPFTAGSDAHGPNFVGKTYLEIPGDNLSIEEVLIQIKQRAGRIGGREAGFLEKIIDHLRRNIAKLKIFKTRP